MTLLERILGVYRPETLTGLLDLLAVFGGGDEIDGFVSRLEGLEKASGKNVC